MVPAGPHGTHGRHGGSQSGRALPRLDDAGGCGDEVPVNVVRIVSGFGPRGVTHHDGVDVGCELGVPGRAARVCTPDRNRTPEGHRDYCPTRRGRPPRAQLVTPRACSSHLGGLSTPSHGCGSNASSARRGRGPARAMCTSRAGFSRNTEGRCGHIAC